MEDVVGGPPLHYGSLDLFSHCPSLASASCGSTFAFFNDTKRRKWLGELLPGQTICLPLMLK